MKNKVSGFALSGSEYPPYLYYLLKWVILSTIVAILAGSASAIFLISLDWVTTCRVQNPYLVAFLPLAGLMIGLWYHYWGKDIASGNNLLLEEYHNPTKRMPLKMAPMILLGTLTTHLFGGSAGREGTAVQMGGALSDQLSLLPVIQARERKILLLCGISAGFASVFGTPLAGAVFALEVLILGRMRYEALIPVFLSAVLADYVCHLWPVHHVHYTIPFVPEVSPVNLLLILAAGLIFGLAARVFSKSTSWCSAIFQRKISYPPFRPLLGGAIVSVLVLSFGAHKYIGLGIPTIQAAFSEPLFQGDFILKILFTAITLGAGFKGGEVTPLFFIGATLGNALTWFIPLPMALMAGVGFVAVFSGATNTPIACTIMGMELFGAECGIYVAIACVTAYLFSGHSGIYSSQIIGSPKHTLFSRFKSKRLKNL